MTRVKSCSCSVGGRVVKGGNNMKVLIDGVEVQVINDIRVLHDLDDGRVLQVVANHEGLVYDLFSGEELAGTSYDFVTDIVARIDGE